MVVEAPLARCALPWAPTNTALTALVAPPAPPRCLVAKEPCWAGADAHPGGGTEGLSLRVGFVLPIHRHSCFGVAQPHGHHSKAQLQVPAGTSAMHPLIISGSGQQSQQTQLTLLAPFLPCHPTPGQGFPCFLPLFSLPYASCSMQAPRRPSPAGFHTAQAVVDAVQALIGAGAIAALVTTLGVAGTWWEMAAQSAALAALAQGQSLRAPQGLRGCSHHRIPPRPRTDRQREGDTFNCLLQGEVSRRSLFFYSPDASTINLWWECRRAVFLPSNFTVLLPRSSHSH